MSGKKLNEFSNNSLRKIAKEVVVRKFVLILHIWIYVLVNILLFAINYFTYPTSPIYFWFLWPLTAWMMILIGHIFAHTMFRKGIVDLHTVFILYHMVSYVVVNLFLIFTNWFTTASNSSRITWVWWIIGPWSILFIIHLIVYFYVVPKRGESPNRNWLERKIDKELERMKKKYKEGGDE
ncbi:MAG: 2TM domain-containing protein [Promethearchaeota archaeon]